MKYFCWEIRHYLTFYDFSLTIKHGNKQKRFYDLLNWIYFP